MLRWQCQSGVGGGQAIIPGGQILMLSCLSDTVETTIRIDLFDAIIIPANAYFTIGAHEFGYHWRVCEEGQNPCFGVPDCDKYPGEKQISIQFSADNEDGGPLSWFVAWVGC